MRHYLPGDDIRSIDWKATARTGTPHVRVFTEERDRPALLVVDQRMSMFFGSVLNMKSVTAAEAAAMAAFRILVSGDRVGGIVFDDERQIEVRPQRNARSLYALLEGIAEMNAGLHADRQVDSKPELLNQVLGQVARIAHHDHLILAFSDFDGIDETTHRRLRGIVAHNDLILMLVHDPAALKIQSQQRMVFGDGQVQAEMDLGSRKLREALGGYSKERLERIYRWQNEIKLSVLPLRAGEDTLPQLRCLMGRLEPRRRVR